MIQNVLAFVVLSEEDDVLLVQPDKKESVAGDLYALVGTNVEQGETVLQAIRREVKEEINLGLPESDFSLMHVSHGKDSKHEFIAFFFHVDISEFSLEDNESSKYSDMEFFDINELPNNIIPSHEQALDSIKKAVLYSEHGWD